MSNTESDSQGSVDFKVGNESFNTFFKVFGDLNIPNIIPLIIIHGGPGAAHNYLVSISDLKSQARPVVFYDQIGCGSSSSPILNSKPKDFWTPELFMDEFDNLVDKLLPKSVTKYDVLGHSWGGMLAAQIAATRQPEGLRRLIISNSPASMPLWEVAARGLVQEMPEDVREAIKYAEENNTFSSPEFERAMEAFYTKHVCRLQPMPEPVKRSFALMAENPTVYHTMWVTPLITAIPLFWEK